VKAGTRVSIHHCWYATPLSENRIWRRSSEDRGKLEDTNSLDPALSSRSVLAHRSNLLSVAFPSSSRTRELYITAGERNGTLIVKP